MTPAEYRVLQLAREWQNGGHSVRFLRDLSAAIYDLPPEAGIDWSEPLPEISAAHHAANLAKGYLLQNNIKGVRVSVTLSPQIRRRLSDLIMKRHEEGKRTWEIAREFRLSQSVVGAIIGRRKRELRHALNLLDGSAAGVAEEAEAKHIP